MKYSIMKVHYNNQLSFERIVQLTFYLQSIVLLTFVNLKIVYIKQY